MKYRALHSASRLLWVHTCCALAFLAIGCGRAPAERPNVVIILADDLGYSDIGAYGGEIATPNLDSLAAGGLRFRQFYNAGRCCPTRASLLTGRYPHAVGMGGMVSATGNTLRPGPYQGYLSEEATTIAEMLRDSGYRTYMSGKWHVGERPQHWPRHRGFDRYFGLISGASSYFELIKDQPRVRKMALDDTPWEPPTEDFYMTDAFSDYAVEFLQEHEASATPQPFLLYLAYTAPHWPLHALPEDIARYAGRYHIGWDSLRAERHARMLEMGLIDERHVVPPRPAQLSAWEDAENKEDWARRMAVYAAMVDRMDQGIGKVMDQLRAMDALDNTLVVFLADNGGCAESIGGRRLHDPTKLPGERGSYVAYQEGWAMASNTPFRLYKQWVHEGGILTPFIAHWPRGIGQVGHIMDGPGHIMDLLPTIQEISGSALPVTDGTSLVPHFQRQPVELEGRTLYWEHIRHRAVRQDSWKLVMDRRVGEWELYNLDTDPVERQDLIASHPDLADNLAGLWHAWADSLGVRVGSR